ncbi:MAG TPA: hypothetical protein VL096_20935 [Pirellulaceae bacterium]|nr:hypothetical protein [Pirellulaceae bacterium]
MTQPETPSRKLAPVPTYRTRKERLRLFVIVAACMGVLYLVTEAAQPGRWGIFADPAPEAKTPAEEKIDPRLDALPIESLVASVLPDAVRITDPLRAKGAPVEQATDGVSRSLADGWQAFYQSLSGEQRMLIAKAFHEVRLKRALNAQDAAAWQALLITGDEFWRNYRENATKTLASEGNQLAPEEMAAWLMVLGKVGEEWVMDRDVLSSLTAPPAADPNPAHAARLAKLQQRWERLALAAIKDDTVHRPAETDAWFRLFDVLNTTPAAELQSLPAQSVTYVQLFKQPNDYRGKLVRIRGRVRQAAKFTPPKNAYDIQQQYILWLHPEGGGDAPVVVYALEMPAGFPSLDEPNLPNGYTKLREDVEVTGYFFKRYAYRAQDGVNTAPLILTKMPVWIPSVDVNSVRVSKLPSAQTFGLWVAGCAALAIALVTAVYLRTRVVSPAIESHSTSPLAQAELRQSIDNAVAGPDVMESLRRLEQRDQTGSGEQS